MDEYNEVVPGDADGRPTTTHSMDDEKESLNEEASVSAALAQVISKNKQCLICGDNSHTIEECTISTNMVCFNCNKKGHLRKACHLQRRISI